MARKCYLLKNLRNKLIRNIQKDGTWLLERFLELVFYKKVGISHIIEWAQCLSFYGKYEIIKIIWFKFTIRSISIALFNLFHKFIVFKSTAFSIIIQFIFNSLFFYKALPIHFALMNGVNIPVTRSKHSYDMIQILILILKKLPLAELLLVLWLLLYNNRLFLYFFELSWNFIHDKLFSREHHFLFTSNLLTR